MRKEMFVSAAMAAVGGALFAATPVVVIPDEPTPVERSAAAELAGELGKCLGATPKVVAESKSLVEPSTNSGGARLFVGATKAAKQARAAADGTGCRPYQVDV